MLYEGLLIYLPYLFIAVFVMRLKVVIRRDKVDGGYVASCPALPGCHSQGENLSEVRANIREAILGCLDVLNSRTHVRTPLEKIIEVAV